MLLQQTSYLEPVFPLLTLSKARLSENVCRECWWVLAPLKASGVKNGGLPRTAEGVSGQVPGLGQTTTLSTWFYLEETFGDIILPMSIEDGLTSMSHDFLSFRMREMEMVPPGSQHERVHGVLLSLSQALKSPAGLVKMQTLIQQVWGCGSQ